MTDPTDELRTLLRAATPGPWRVWLDGDYEGESGTPSWEANFPHVAQWLSGDPDEGVEGDWGGNIADLDRSDERYHANAALIVAAVNALPHLLSQHEADKREIGRLTGLLRPFANVRSDRWDDWSDEAILEVSQFNTEAWNRRPQGGLRVKHFRAARQALTPKESGDE